jgi:hypothetical protein
MQQLLQVTIEQDPSENDPENDCQEQANRRKNDPGDSHVLAPGVDAESTENNTDHTEQASAHKEA